MKIIKRNGSEAVFDITKIIAAITKAIGAAHHGHITAGNTLVDQLCHEERNQNLHDYLYHDKDRRQDAVSFIFPN